MPIGFGKVKERMSAQEYFDQLVSGELTDPTLSAQMKVGFRPQKLIEHYLHGPVCGNYGILIVEENPLLASWLEGREVHRGDNFKTEK